MNLRVLLTCLLLSVSAATAMAAGPYVGAAGGASFFNDQDIHYQSGAPSTAELNTGYGFNVSAGYNLVPVRVEFEFGYKKADVDHFIQGGVRSSGSGSDSTILSYMANVYYDYRISPIFTPYAGVGLGAVNGEFQSPGFSSNDTEFGYQFIVGTAFNMNRNVALDLSYRFQGAASDFRLNNGADVSYTSSNLMAGLRFNF